MRNFSSYKRFSTLIKIDYQKLTDPNYNLNDEIHESFGRKGLGLCVIKNIPEYSQVRTNILKQGFKLGNLPEIKLKQLEKPECKYQVGWSKGRSYSDSEYEYLMGSFYARPERDCLINPLDIKSENDTRNIWPDGSDLPNFKTDLESVSHIMIKIQTHLLNHFDRYLNKFNKTDYHSKLYDTFSNNHDCMSRLLVYYPSNSLGEHIIKEKGVNAKKNWCGWHRDFGLVTALTHPIYFNKNGLANESIKSGLLVKDREGVINDIQYDKDEIALQTGDASFILSGGNIISTPHAVKVTDGIPDDAFRVTFVNFYDPEYNYKLYLPQNYKENEIFEKDPFKMENVLTKFKNGLTYNEFIASAFETYFPKP